MADAYTEAGEPRPTISSTLRYLNEKIIMPLQQQMPENYNVELTSDETLINVTGENQLSIPLMCLNRVDRTTYHLLTSLLGSHYNLESSERITGEGLRYRLRVSASIEQQVEGGAPPAEGHARAGRHRSSSLSGPAPSGYGAYEAGEPDACGASCCGIETRDVILFLAAFIPILVGIFYGVQSTLQADTVLYETLAATGTEYLHAFRQWLIPRESVFPAAETAKNSMP